MGQLRRKLIELGIERQTLVLFFSDNGASAYDFPSGDPRLRGNKGSVYEGGHKVPFIAWWPGKITPGTESEFPGITLDIMPTVLKLAGVKPSVQRPMDGVDLSGLLLNRETPESRPLFWASLSNRGSRAEAMRDGPWKLVVPASKSQAWQF